MMITIIIEEGRFDFDQGSFLVGNFVDDIFLRDGNMNAKKTEKGDMNTKKTERIASLFICHGRKDFSGDGVRK